MSVHVVHLLKDKYYPKPGAFQRIRFDKVYAKRHHQV